MEIPFAKVDSEGKEQEYISEVLASGWLTTAGKAAEFEEQFRKAVRTRYACAVNSCTAALHLSLEAMGIGAEDKVLVQSMTFTASAEIIRYLGAHPVFLDCDPHTRLVTPEILERAIMQNKDAKALIVVHFSGQAAQMMDKKDKPGILSLCHKHGLKLIEDAAHAFPTRHNGRMVGSFGDATCFSFYANKTITTGEGGMVVTDSEDVWKRVKVMRLHGIDRDIWDRFTSVKPDWEYDVVAPGFKYNLPDINAALGLAQLERAEELRKAREFCCRYYHKHLAELPCLQLPLIECSWAEHSCHLYPVIIRDSARVTRDEFIAAMGERGIGTGVHYKPLHRMSYYRDMYNLDPIDFPCSEFIWKGTVSLPVYPSLKESELRYICKSIKVILEG